ncbi:cytochrome c [Crateriforma conspicua]|uniref:Cytochrome c n=1 Tax=Crateriforma conspicua TaxID=2527996 RepID=A0A5C5Y835_9PLAN|nr:c-type cytochrome [Crateriforma conspicua]TWT71139.1 Cytochrome c [Crateriforma conspicua]
MTFRYSRRPILICLAAALSVAAWVGCEKTVDQFDPNLLYALSLEKTRDIPADVAAEHVQSVITELFGTPLEPRWPSDWLDDEQSSILRDVDNLELAIGKISSDQADQHRGLYREHCVICHGVSGSGNGPASLYQNPYPRDFRRGVFKWKSTERRSKPTREDLLDLLKRGIPGTSMPSYRILSSEQRQTLVDYTIYLSVRGETERELMAVAVDELGYEDTPPEDDLNLAMVFESEGGRGTEAADVIADVLDDVVGQWRDASDEVVDVPQVPQDLLQVGAADAKKFQWSDEAVAMGRDVYEGVYANCVGCHGKGGRADVPTLDYDDWTKEYTSRIGISPDDTQALAPVRALGALPPRPVLPRRLSDGVYRGAGTPEAIYRIISQGIAGSPMPAVMISEQGDGTSLSPRQIWALVAYVQSLGQGAAPADTAAASDPGGDKMGPLAWSAGAPHESNAVPSSTADSSVDIPPAG